MGLTKRYNPHTIEPQLQSMWRDSMTYYFNQKQSEETYIIDTPPPTVSGHLHLGHVYSYSHADFFARFWRMNGRNVLYPMGFDDNGLPTERLVERRLKMSARDMGRSEFIKQCQKVSVEAEIEYETLWKRLALSVDWRFTYRTIDDDVRRISQLSFIDLFKKNLIYRKRAPTIWCPECRTAISQADVSDMSRESEFVTLSFELDGHSFPIATTRPELLPACVAVFVNPDDERYGDMIGRMLRVPLFGQQVKIIADPAADPEVGTGAVMCCTFGDTMDVAWWRTYDLNLIEAISSDGTMTDSAGEFAGMDITTARRSIKEKLIGAGLLDHKISIEQNVRVHERCDTPVEYIVTSQWFVRILENKEKFLENGRQVDWYPAHMKNRYAQWVENLSWDWCISRQRYYGVTFPIWYCTECEEVMLALESELPVDPVESQPGRNCSCGNDSFTPDRDIMDTWATSSLTPQLVGRWLQKSGFDGQIFEPISIRTQAHEIIRTWAFYTIVKSQYHFNSLPWKTAAISGWALSPSGSGKISKSKGGGPLPPMEMIERYSADAVRYWAASTSLGKDAIISQERVQAGAKLVNKLWNVSRFAQRFIAEYQPGKKIPELSPADRWILSGLQEVIEQATENFRTFDYATVKSMLEIFFWNELADNYLEMAKQRLYEGENPGFDGARFALFQALLNIIKLFAPFLPHVTEQIYQGLFSRGEHFKSIHLSPWPEKEPVLIDPSAQEFGQVLTQIATAVRRYKSDNGLSLGFELNALQLATPDTDFRDLLGQAQRDIASITRVKSINIDTKTYPNLTELETIGSLHINLVGE